MASVIRRSFRIGLTLGLLAGVAIALSKMLGGKSQVQVRVERDDTPARAADAEMTPAAAKPAAAPPTPAAPNPIAAAKPAAAKPAASKTGPAKKGPAKKGPPKKKPLTAAWVEPTGDVCPTTHPVKAKLSSKIFHLPGMLNYDRTSPDRCYRDAGSAEGDGLRAAKR